MKVVIVGGVAGGASAAARLRRMDENADIVMVERTGYVSYANCGLPYYVGGEITDQAKLTLQTPASLKAKLAIDARVNSEVVKIDSEKQCVMIKNLLDGTEYEESYDELILSPGAKAVKPNLPGIDLPHIYSVRTVEDTLAVREFVEKEKPQTALVVGGGFIGLEMAENLHNLGIKVNLVEMQNQVMAPFDFEMACNIHNVMIEKGIKLSLGTGVTGFAQVDGKIEASLSDQSVCSVDMVILAIGVLPDTDFLKGTGIQLGIKNAILTDEYMRTNVPHIYAAGDAVAIKNTITDKLGLISLASPANKQGRIIADNICGVEHKYNGAMGSCVLKVFEFTASATGLNEKMAKEHGIEVETTVTVSPTSASYYKNPTPLVMKTVFEKATGKVLGAQCFGTSGVDKRVNVIATAIAGGLTCHDLAELDLAYAPPYSGAKDQVIMAGFIMENILSGKVKQSYWHEIQTILQQEDSILLDVRMANEYAETSVKGSVNISLETLRERLQELDQNKKIYVLCASGYRAYMACCVLNQHGFNSYNISGGIKLYDIVRKNRVEVEPILACGIKEKEMIVTAKETVENNCTLTEEQIKSVKGLGFLHCKGTDNFNGRIITRNGKVTTTEMQTITDAANTFGNGEVTMTTRLTMEVQSIPFDKIAPFREAMAAGNLLTGGTGSKVRPVVSCKGTTCQYGLIDTYALSDKIHDRFYVNYHEVNLPHKFKIAVGGCPNNCVKPNLNDLGIVGQRIVTLDTEKCKGCGKCAVEAFCPIKSAKVENGKLVFGEQCNRCGRCIPKCHFGAVSGEQYGYQVYVGGRWGKKIMHGLPLSKIFTSEEEVLDVVEKAILLFRKEGISGERFADTVTRLGMEKVEEMLVSDELLKNKNKILGINMEGGATC